LKLTVSVGTKNRYFDSGVAFSEIDFQGFQLGKKTDKLSDHRKRLNFLLGEAERIAKEMDGSFSFELFKKRFKQVSKDSYDQVSLRNGLDMITRHYEETGQYSMTVKMKDSVASLIRFLRVRDGDHTVNDCPIGDLNVAFCNDYENYMANKSPTNSRNGAGINLRHLRVIFKHLIETGMIKPNLSPFGREKGRYTIPNEQKIKYPLTKEQVWKLINFQASDPLEKNAVIAFLSSYFFNGSNAADFLRFRFNQIKESQLEFYRAKTRRTRKANAIPIRVIIYDKLWEFIKELGGDDTDPNNFIVPYLKRGMSVQEEYDAIKQFNRRAGAGLQRIAKKLGLKKMLTMKIARHTLATILFAEGVRLDIIKYILGHANLATTQVYLGSIDCKEQLDSMKKATDFTGYANRMQTENPTHALANGSGF
jgi:site-specific recombinase XerD